MKPTEVSTRTTCPRCGAPSIVATYPDGRRRLLSLEVTVPGVASAWGAHRCGE